MVVSVQLALDALRRVRVGLRPREPASGVIHNQAWRGADIEPPSKRAESCRGHTSLCLDNLLIEAQT